MSTLIERVQERIAQLQARETEIAEELSAIADDPESRGLDTDAALERVGELRTEVAQIRLDLAEAEERAQEITQEQERRAAADAVRPQTTSVGGARVISEARTYEAHNAQERSFFADAYAARFGGNSQAQERLERHAREVEVERRDISSSTLNGLIPPLYLLDQAATLARAMRPFADVLPSYDLPSNGMSVVVTKVTTGTATAVQTSENTGATETDLVTTDITIPVVTIMGQQDVSRQAIERGAVTDSLIFSDLVADYATKLDAQAINGSAANGQHRGVLQVSGIGVQTWGGTTVASFISKLNGNLNDVATNRFAPATVIAMHPRRWHWLLAQADTVGRNVVLPAQNQPQNATGIGQTGYGVVGTLAGLPVVADANIPTTASTDQDRVIVTRLSDHALWEGDLMTFSFEQAVNPPATVRLAVAGYSAFTAERYPAATSVMVGTGLVAPSF